MWHSFTCGMKVWHPSITPMTLINDLLVLATTTRWHVVRQRKKIHTPAVTHLAPMHQVWWDFQISTNAENGTQIYTLSFYPGLHTKCMRRSDLMLHTNWFTCTVAPVWFLHRGRNNRPVVFYVHPKPRSLQVTASEAYPAVNKELANSLKINCTSSSGM